MKWVCLEVLIHYFMEFRLSVKSVFYDHSIRLSISVTLKDVKSKSMEELILLIYIEEVVFGNDF